MFWWCVVGCCVTEGVSAYCHKLCSQRALWGASDADLLLCSSNLRTIAACATSTSVHIVCCVHFSLRLFNELLYGCFLATS